MLRVLRLSFAFAARAVAGSATSCGTRPLRICAPGPAADDERRA